MISTPQLLRVCLANQTPVYVGNCIKYMITGDSKDKLSVSFSYDSIQGLFILDHEKTYARAPIKEHSSLASYHSLPFEHGRTCPCYTMNTNSDVYSFQSTNTYVRLSCSTLLIDSKNNILLTRRDKKLRSFPGAWVNPGGRLDPGETLNTCALRELKEEVGVSIDQKEDILRGQSKYFYAGKECEVKPFMVYESVFPTLLDQGFPKVQYLVIFYYVKIQTEFSKIKVKIQDEEIDKGIWINIPYLLSSIENKKSVSEPLKCHNLAGGSVKSGVIPSESFEGIYPNSIKEGLGEGHFLALKHYYSQHIADAMNIES